jgi:hypothetical protein
MNRATQIAADLQILREICDEAMPLERRRELLRRHAQHVFVDPEHQVVFESIQRLFQGGSISAARLTVHLNNRGFPEINIGCYFPATPADRNSHELVSKGSIHLKK